MDVRPVRPVKGHVKMTSKSTENSAFCTESLKIAG